jgi:hypothetical protein
VKAKKLKAKIYHITIGSKQLLVKAKTKAGAIGYVAQRMIKCEYADQATLYRLTKAGVEAVDLSADKSQSDLWESLPNGTAGPQSAPAEAATS